jgi:hypothetical protein
MITFYSVLKSMLMLATMHGTKSSYSSLYYMQVLHIDNFSLFKQWLLQLY